MLTGPKQTYNVLAVDGHQVALQLMANAPRDAPLNVQMATSTEDMFDALQHADFDLILLDVRLPGMDGLEATRILRRESNTALILVSVLGAAKMRAIGIELGADDYLCSNV